MPIHDTLVSACNGVQDAITAIAGEIQDEAQKGNFDRVDVLTQAAKRLNKLDSDIESEHATLGCCPAKATTQLQHQFVVYISQGALNSNYFVVTAAFKLGWMKPNQPVRIKLPSGVEFDTVAIAPNRLQERGKIGAFYKATQVKAGDMFVVAEISPSVWEIKKP